MRLLTEHDIRIMRAQGRAIAVIGFDAGRRWTAPCEVTVLGIAATCDHPGGVASVLEFPSRIAALGRMVARALREPPADHPVQRRVPMLRAQEEGLRSTIPNVPIVAVGRTIRISSGEAQLAGDQGSCHGLSGS